MVVFIKVNFPGKNLGRCHGSGQPTVFPHNISKVDELDIG
jgi:hypothetical protein